MKYYPAALLHKVKHHLKQGGVIAYPTESCYGLGCDPLNYKAINKIIQIKGRAKTKGLIVIAGKISQLDRLIQPLSDRDLTEIKSFWPGFYSLLLPVKSGIPRNLTGIHHKIACRVTTHQQVRQLCNFLDMALVSTSANKSGQNSLKSTRECQHLFGTKVMVLPGLTQFAKKPSKIIDWQTRNILR